MTTALAVAALAALVGGLSLVAVAAGAVLARVADRVLAGLETGQPNSPHDADGEVPSPGPSARCQP